MKDLEGEEPPSRDKNKALTNGNSSTAIDDDYNFTDDQRKATLELQSLYLKLGLEDLDDGFEEGFSAYDDPQYDIVGRLRQVNTQFAEDITPLESDRLRKVRFKESVVDLVVPISPIRTTLQQEEDDYLDQSEPEDDYYDNYYGGDEFETDKDWVVGQDVNELQDKLSEEEEEINGQGPSEGAEAPEAKKVTIIIAEEDNASIDGTELQQSKLDELKGDEPVFKPTESSHIIEKDPDETQTEVDEVKSKSTRPKSKMSQRSGGGRPRSAPDQKQNQEKPKTRPASSASIGKELSLLFNERSRPMKSEKFLPSYKGNSRSKYGVSDELKRELRKLKQLEAFQMKLREHDQSEDRRRKREEAEAAFKAWLVQKKSHEKNKSKDVKQEPKSPSKKPSNESEQAYTQWWEQKQNQIRKEKVFQKLVADEENVKKTKPDQSKKEYRRWLKKKNLQRRHQLALQAHYLQIPSHLTLSLPQAIHQAEMLKRTFQAYFGSSLW